MSDTSKRRGGPYPVYGDVLGMWAGLRANVPVVNGYSGRWPNGYPSADVMSDDDLRAWLGRSGFRGRVAVVNPSEPDRVRWVEVR